MCLTSYAEYLPLVTSQTYDNTQNAYSVSKILGNSFTLDVEKYHNYSPLFLSPTLALNYGLSFAALTAALVHVALFDGKEIWYRFKASRNQEPDIHLKLMKKYVDAPEWWYTTLLVISLALGLGTVLGYDSQLPWWGFFVSVILAFVFVVPTCMIMAVSNITLSLNVISPFIAGFIFPGRPIAVMIFKVFSTITLGQAQTYGMFVTRSPSSPLSYQSHLLTNCQQYVIKRNLFSFYSRKLLVLGLINHVNLLYETNTT